MNLSKKQKEVIKLMTNGSEIHWMDGLNARCFMSHDIRYPLSTATFFKLKDLNLFEEYKTNTYRLSEYCQNLLLNHVIFFGFKIEEF